MKDSKFLLVDINSYFATLAQQENPYLRNKPLVVVKDLGRTCVIAASKEAKKLGIKTGSNLHQAKQLVPNLVVIPAEFEMYLSATKKLKKIFCNISPDVQVYSLDEAFIDLSSCREYLYQDLQQLGQEIQQQIKRELGDWVTANVGIGNNRFLAKMAAEIASKGSVFKIDSDNIDLILATVTFEDVCGVGYRLSKKLSKLGIYHPYQIRFYRVEDLELWFGSFWSRELLKMAYGEEPHHLSLLNDQRFLSQRMRSVSRSITAWQKITDLSEIKRIVLNLSREVIYKARRMNLSGRQVGLYLIGGDNICWGKHLTFKDFINHTKEMVQLFAQWFDHDWRGQFAPIKFVVFLSLLEPNDKHVNSLLPSWQKNESLEAALDAIDDKYGLHTVRSGLMIQSKAVIQPEVTGFLGDQDYQFNYR